MNLKLIRILIVLVFIILVSEKSKGQGATEVCVGSIVSYTATPADPSNSFQWYIEAGVEGVDWSIDSENTPETNIEWLSPGIYTLTIIETDIDGVETEIDPYPLVVTVHSLPVATIDYAGSPYCAAGTAAVTITGLVTGGEFSSTESLAIDPLTGEIDCAASIPDTYFVTYTYTDGYCYNTTNTIVTINPLPDATIVYPLSPYCPSGTASPELTGTAGGSYHSTTGLIFYNSSTGVIDLDSSTPGLYTISYEFTNGTCSNTTTADITIQSLTTTTIGYPASPYCGSGTAVVILTGLGGGIFSGGSGLIVDNTTGTVDLAESSPDTYTVYYDYTEGECSDVASTEITISEPLTATISYPEIPVCATGSVSVVRTGETGGSFSSSEGLSVNISSGAINLDSSIPGTYTVVYTFGSGSCTYTTSESVTINARPDLPSAAGLVTGPSTFTPGDAGVAYSTDLIEGAVSYVWNYSGDGVTVNGTGTGVTLDFSSSATEGFLTVRGRNLCGLEGPESSYELKFDTKTLNLTSVLLQGLYESGGVMRQAWNATGPQFPSGIADQITVELHEALNYSSIAQTIPNVPLSTTGSAQVILPGTLIGSYYITVKHRNSIETTTSAPVSFSGSNVNQSFNTPLNIFGGNLVLSSDSRYMIYGGDINQDGSVDTGDYIPVVNDVSGYAKGYLATDVDGNGSIDTGDYLILVNNASRYTRTYHP